MKQISTGEKVSSAFGKIGDSKSLSVSFSLDATAAQLVALDQGTPDAMKAVDAKNVAGLGATLTMSADKPLSQVFKAEQAQGASAQPDPSLEFDLEIHAGGGKSLFEMRQVAGLDYLRVDLANLEALSDDPSTDQSLSGLQSEMGEMPPAYAPFKDLVEDKWVSFDPKQMAQLSKSLQGAGGSSALPTPLPSFDASTGNQLFSAVRSVFEQDVTLTDKGSSNGQDHVVLQAPELKLVTGLQQAIEPIAKQIPEVGSSFPTAAPTGIPAGKDVDADLYIGSDGALSKVTFDFWQLNPKGKPGEHLPLSLDFNDQAPAPVAPAGAVAFPVNLLQNLVTAMASAGGTSAGSLGS